jgi:hypothetical protein
LGLDSATELYGMDKAMIDSVYKRLVKDAEDITIPEERRPRSTIRVMGAITTVVSAVKYYADRGVPLALELLEMMHHRKAVNFYNRFSQGRRRLKAVETAKGGDDDYPNEWDHAGRFLTDAQRKSEAQFVPHRVYKEYTPDK